MKLRLQLRQALLREGDLVELLLGALGILENVLHAAAIFPLEPVEHIQSAFNLLELLPGIGQLLQPVAKLPGKILRLVLER